MITGIQLSSIKKYMQTEADLRLSLARLAEIGYRTAQLQWHGMDIPVSVIANALKDCGITAVSVQDYTHVVLDAPDYFLSLADSCQFADITISGIPAEELTIDGIRRFAERISPFLRRLTAEGHTLSFHPRWQELSDIFYDLADQLAAAIQKVFEKTPPELAGDVKTNGILLTGGGAKLHGLDKFFEKRFNLKVSVAQNPEECVAIGTGETFNLQGYLRDCISEANNRLHG